MEMICHLLLPGFSVPLKLSYKVVFAGCGKKIKDGGLKYNAHKKTDRALITPFLFISSYSADIPGNRSAVSWELFIQTLSRCDPV